MNRKILLFAQRNVKEILRDPINLFFGLGFPLVLLLLLSVINSNIPKEANNPTFAIQNLAPGVAMFGCVFMALFSGMLISKDRTSSFLVRLFTSPMKASDFILGYIYPMIIFAMLQSLITFLAAILFGFEFTANSLLAILVLIPITILFVSIGLICGSVMNDRAVGGICGALLTNVAGWFAGIWFPLELVGGTFKKICELLPFYHAAQATTLVVKGKSGEIWPHLSVVLLYSVILTVIAIVVFTRKMSSDKQ